MKDKKNIICIALIALWIALGITLVIRVPMMQVVEEGNGKLYTVDTILSTFFVALSFVSAPLGYFLGKKSAIGLGFANLTLCVLALLCFLLFITTSNGLMVGYGIMLLNPYCVLFAMRGAAAIFGIIIYVLSCIVFPILFSLLFKFKPLKTK